MATLGRSARQSGVIFLSLFLFVLVVGRWYMGNLVNMLSSRGQPPVACVLSLTCRLLL